MTEQYIDLDALGLDLTDILSLPMDEEAAIQVVLEAARKDQVNVLHARKRNRTKYAGDPARILNTLANFMSFNAIQLVMRLKVRFPYS